MITAKDIYKTIEKIAPFSLAYEFDNVGLLVDMGNETDKVLFALDATGDVINEAKRKGCGVIVTHHPVIFSGVKSLDATMPSVVAAMNGISVVSAHTNFDTADGGVGDTLCALLGITVKDSFGGYCKGGTIKKELSGRELAESVKKRLNCDAVRLVDSGKRIKKVAVAGGSAGDSAMEAAKLGYDALVTGELKHSAANAAKAAGICVVEAGHFKTENPAVKVLRDAVKKRIGAKAECLLSDTSADPFAVI